MVVIRLARKGAKKNPFYHIVAADSRYPRDGRYIEQLGYFNPTARGNEIRLDINQERVEHWINQGAQPSERMGSLIKEHKKGARPSAISVADYKKAQAEASAKAAKTDGAKVAEDTSTQEAPAETAKEEPAAEAPAETVKKEEPAAEAPAETAKKEEPAAEAPAETAKEEPAAEAPAETAKEEPAAETAKNEDAAADGDK